MFCAIKIMTFLGGFLYAAIAAASYDTSANGDQLHCTFASAIDTPYSIVAWINLPAATWADTSDDRAVMLNDDRVDSDQGIYLGKDNTADSVRVQAVTTSGTEADYAFTDGDYDGIWVPLVGVFASATDHRVYIENSSNTDQQTTERNVDPVDEVSIGGATHTNFLQLGGLIAEVAIFDKALSTSEIDALQTSAETGPSPCSVAAANCIGYWSLSTDQTTHADESGNGGPSCSEQSGVPFDADHPTITSSVAAKRRRMM